MKNKIVVCMGSSCYLRGNRDTLEIIKRYIAENNFDADIELKGALCEEKCKYGPNIRINDMLYSNVEPNTVTDILNHCFKAEK